MNYNNHHFKKLLDRPINSLINLYIFVSTSVQRVSPIKSDIHKTSSNAWRIVVAILQHNLLLRRAAKRCVYIFSSTRQIRIKGLCNY